MARILIVDDDTQFRSALARVIESLGHEVEALADGNAAIASYRARIADVVFLDMFMPEPDGIESTLQFQREFPGARIIGMSGGDILDRATVLDIARQLGAVRTLEKPFGVDEARAVIDAVLGAGGHST